MFTTVRNIIGIIVFIAGIVISYIVILKNPQKNVQKQFLISGIIIGVGSYLIYMLSFLIPFEYYLLPMKSPAEVVEYTYEDCKILETIEVENTAFVVFETNNIQFASISKDHGAWRVLCPIYLPSSQHNIVQTKAGGVFLIQIPSQDKTNKLIAVKDSFLLNGPVVHNISDNIDSTFSKLYGDPYSNSAETIVYYTVIDTDISNYQLTINEKTIEL